MFNRRSFFSRLGAIVATVAIAPEIAFANKLPLPITPAVDAYYADISTGYIYKRYVTGKWVLARGMKSGGKSCQ